MAIFRPIFRTGEGLNHVNSGLATVSRRRRFFLTYVIFAVGRDSRLFDLGSR